MLACLFWFVSDVIVSTLRKIYFMLVFRGTGLDFKRTQKWKCCCFQSIWLSVNLIVKVVLFHAITMNDDWDFQASKRTKKHYKSGPKVAFWYMIALCNAQSKWKLFFTVKLVVTSETESLSQCVELISPIHEGIIQTIRIICELDQPIHLQQHSEYSLC